ncbi:MAG TPA: hypothetical protein VI072_02670 [Polyangiaceae bacterium]
MILDYIHQMSLGALPFWDKADAYGVFNWVLPVLFYTWAGQKVWGIRLFLLLLKLVSVALAYRLVARVTRRFYGLLAALGLLVLLGQRWQALQTAYAFLSVVPLILAATYFIVVQPLRPARNALLASVFTTLTVWTKLNTGVYLFVAGYAALLFWPPSTHGSDASEPVAGAQPTAAVWVTRWRIAFGVACAGAFSVYLSRHFEFLYFLYLALPLWLVFGWAVYRASATPHGTARAALGPSTIFLCTTLGSSLLILLGYYGVQGGVQYASELSALLATISYHSPFPPLGTPLLYTGFNENYWPQLPWLFTILFALWIGLGMRFGERAFGASWPEKSRQMSSIMLLVTLSLFVLYPRSDDMHIFQALLLVVPLLFVPLFQIGVFLECIARGWGSRYTEGLALVSAVYGSSLTVHPTLDAIRSGPGDYASPRLEYVRFRPLFNPYVRDFLPGMSDREWDQAVAEVAAYVDELADDNEPILVLCDDHLIHAAARTTSVGERYAFYFYLISVRLLDRAGFDQLVPREIISDIVDAPPRFIVTAGDDQPLVRAFPELRELRDRRYHEVKAARFLRVYRLLE